MYEYVRCPSCNKSIGEFYQLFQAMRVLKLEKKIKETTTIPSSFVFDDSFQDDCLDIFELLGIQRICCRAKLSTVKRFNNTLYEDYNE